MKYITDNPMRPVVELTRRNLETLLAKLDDPESRRPLLSPVNDNGQEIVVIAVENEAHYSDRAPGITYTNGEFS